MDKPLEEIYQALLRLVGLHRQLLDLVRVEREALAQANLRAIEDVTISKQGIVEQIREAESARLRALAELVLRWKKPARELTLANIAIAVQGHDPKSAEQLRSVYNTLAILIKRAKEQNDENRTLVEKSLDHLQQMKRNVLGESSPKTDVYNQRGHKASGSGNSRFLSKEA